MLAISVSALLELIGHEKLEEGTPGRPFDGDGWRGVLTDRRISRVSGAKAEGIAVQRSFLVQQSGLLYRRDLTDGSPVEIFDGQLRFVFFRDDSDYLYLSDGADVPVRRYDPGYRPTPYYSLPPRPGDLIRPEAIRSISRIDVSGKLCYSVSMTSSDKATAPEYRVDIDAETGYLVRAGDDYQWLYWHDVEILRLANVFHWSGPSRTVEEARSLRT